MCLLLPAVAADGVGNLGAEQNHLSVPLADHGAWATAMNNLGIMPMGISGQPLVSGTFYSKLLMLISPPSFNPWLLIIFIIYSVFSLIIYILAVLIFSTFQPAIHHPSLCGST